jgi:type II secretory pathway component PulK
MYIQLPSGAFASDRRRAARAPVRLRRRRERGIAVIVVLALLSILVVYLGANIRSLQHLHREMKFIEQQQTRRLTALCATNTASLPFPVGTTNAAVTNALSDRPAGHE